MEDFKGGRHMVLRGDEEGISLIDGQLAASEGGEAGVRGRGVMIIPQSL